LADETEAAEALERFAPPGAGQAPLIAIHPAAGDGRRRWPAGDFAQVARQLGERGCTVAIVGSPEDRELTASVAGQAGGATIDLGGRLTLNGLAGLLHRADLMIANDSGPLHLAGAAGTATVGIFWCGNLITAGPLGRSQHRPLCSWRLECPVCGVNCITGHCDHHESFVADVPPEDVLGEALSLLANR
jgi:ADP-heptose:LPS heptosyltransferase